MNKFTYLIFRYFIAFSQFMNGYSQQYKVGGDFDYFSHTPISGKKVK